MGIRFLCPNGHKLNVKTFLAGKRGVCPNCGAKFVIPTSPDALVSERPQPVGDGQAYSVETVSPTQRTRVAASPSIIIAVADVEAPSPATTPDSLAIDAVESRRTAEPSVPVTMAPKSLAVIEPVVVDSEAQYLRRRQQRRRNQLIISIVLLAMVIVLSFVLIWVLTRS